MIQRMNVTQVGVLLGTADSCRRLLLGTAGYCWVLQGVSKIYCVSVVTAWGPARKPPPPPVGPLIIYAKATGSHRVYYVNYIYHSR